LVRVQLDSNFQYTAADLEREIPRLY